MRSSAHLAATGLAKACVFGTDDRALVQFLNTVVEIQAATLDDRDRRLASDELTRHSDARGPCANDADLGIEYRLCDKAVGIYLHDCHGSDA